MALNFQVRRADGDAQTDRGRLTSVGLAIKVAVQSVKAERDAWQAKVDAARDLASFAAGTVPPWCRVGLPIKGAPKRCGTQRRAIAKVGEESEGRHIVGVFEAYHLIGNFWDGSSDGLTTDGSPSYSS